jgi:hemin uptake protein HemP
LKTYKRSFGTQKLKAMIESGQTSITEPHKPAEKITSKQLLGVQKKLQIIHAGAEYTLRITANNKLILTK